MKTLTFLATILCVTGAFGQTIPNVPTPAALFTSITGLAGSWTPMLASGGTTIPNVPQMTFGAYCSTDGTGNAGTWAPCPGAGVPAPVTPASCLSAATVSTPCVAYQGSFTGLGISGTTGVQTLYNNNAPAGAEFQFCPTVFIETAGTAGTIAEQTTYTTPGGGVRSASTMGSTALTGTGLVLANCVTVAIAASSTLSFAVLTVGGTGTPVWETQPVVLRMH